MINSYIFYGSSFTAEQTLLKLENSHKQDNSSIHQALLTKMITITAIPIPGLIVAGILSEIKSIGRKTTCFISYAASSFFLFLGVIYIHHFAFFLGISLLCSGAAFNISSTYTSELYPTKIRDLALGFFYFCTRVAGFSSQFLSVALENELFLLNYHVIIAIGIIGGILILYLPYETLGSPIDAPVNSELYEDKK